MLLPRMELTARGGDVLALFELDTPLLRFESIRNAKPETCLSLMLRSLTASAIGRIYMASRAI